MFRHRDDAIEVEYLILPFDGLRERRGYNIGLFASDGDGVGSPVLAKLLRLLVVLTMEAGRRAHSLRVSQGSLTCWQGPGKQEALDETRKARPAG